MDFKKTNGMIRLQVILYSFVGNDLKGIIVYIFKKRKYLYLRQKRYSDLI